MSRYWILGAADPEMAAIERLLDSVGERWRRATSAGVRCSTRTAYSADPIEALGVADADEIILVECDLLGVSSGTSRLRRIDHHRPEDPGYGREPADFLPASSIGQVVSHLSAVHRLPTWVGWVDPANPPGTVHMGYVAVTDDRGPRWRVANGASAREIPADLVLTAAADHCLGAAYRGECPGVDPDTLMRCRLESRASYQGRTVEAVLADVEATRAALRSAARIDLHDPAEAVHTEDHDWSRSVCEGCARDPLWVADMRRDEAAGGPWPELPEAGAREDIGYMSGPLRSPGAPDKFTCSGRPEQVSAWMQWAESRLTDVYGDPARGFAGGYEPPVLR